MCFYTDVYMDTCRCSEASAEVYVAPVYNGKARIKWKDGGWIAHRHY
jgi:hypothetical protein